MRFICLHGVGSSASICEAHFEKFLQAVDPSYEFVFVDGPMPSVRGPGMGAGFDGPFFSHTAGYSPDQMSDALDHFDAAVKELGPFDGVVGFSQGAATAIAYMYDQQTRYERVPFKIALLFSAVCAFSPDSEYAQDTFKAICDRRTDVSSKLDTDLEQPDITAKERIFLNAMSKVIIPLKEAGALLPDIDMDVYHARTYENAPRLLLPELMEDKIRIPTIHVHGKRDAEFMRAMSIFARGMFDGKLIKTSEHSGSHEPPQRDAEVRTAVRALEWTISQARKMGTLN